MVYRATGKKSSTYTRWALGGTQVKDHGSKEAARKYFDKLGTEKIMKKAQGCA